MKKLLAILLLANTAAIAQPLPSKTSFQVSEPFRPEYDIRADVVMVYGINEGRVSFEDRVQGWRERGYNVQFMTGIAWGNYQDYFQGKFDGKIHWEDSQIQMNGDTVGHGHLVPYIVPSASYIKYMQALIKRVVDAGINDIYLEEPEFWAKSGAGDAFKREWQNYYGTPWVPQTQSPEATYLSNKLKYHLYFTALKEVFAYAKKYGEEINRPVKCYVPTHSLINYSSWQIISPEASLASLPGMDGYIAQVWTGTSREPTFFNGIKKERVFENAFLEYGSMYSMTAPTGRQMYFLTDPVEDWPRTWDDYKRNYQATFTAQLMYPQVDHYEVMPWPNRIYLGKFKVEGKEERQPMAPAYATQMQVMVNSLNAMPLSKNKVSGSQGIGVLLSNSMMFQRLPTHKGYEDPQLSNFYGMVLPLLKRGVPVETVHMENLSYPQTLKDIKVLIMSYANMKPLQPETHKYLAEWVKKGGSLIYYGRDNDPFQEVREWWNSGDNKYKAPSENLFELLGLKSDKLQVVNTAGKGKFVLIRKDPKELVLEKDSDQEFVNQVKTQYESRGSNLVLKNNLLLRRGPFVIAAVMDESVSNESLTIRGSFIDLFDPELPLLKEKLISPGSQAYLFDLGTISNRTKPQVLAAACRVYNEKSDAHSYLFQAKSPSKTQNVMRILLPAKPSSVKATDNKQTGLADLVNNYDEVTKTLLLKFENSSDGIDVVIKW